MDRAIKTVRRLAVPSEPDVNLWIFFNNYRNF